MPLLAAQRGAPGADLWITFGGGVGAMMIAVLAMMALAVIGGLVQGAPVSGQKTTVQQSVVAACNASNGNTMAGSCTVSKPFTKSGEISHP